MTTGTRERRKARARAIAEVHKERKHIQVRRCPVGVCQRKATRLGGGPWIGGCACADQVHRDDVRREQDSRR
jgi:hypothetical protein